MAENIENRISSEQAKEAIYQAHLSKDAMGKIEGLQSSASEIDATRSVNQNTFVIDGDSIARQNGYEFIAPVTNNIYNNSIGFFVWANIILKNKMFLLKNNGVSGDRTDQLITRIQNSIDLKPKFMIINIGKNDILQGVSINIIKSNLLIIIEKITKAGIICVMANIIPEVNVNTAKTTNTYIVNEYLRTLQNSISNFILVDFFSAIANPLTDLARTNMLTTDGVHPSTQGAYYMGKELARVVDKYIPEITIFKGGNGNGIITNSYLLGGATTATSWNAVVSGSPVASKVLRENGMEWQQFTSIGLATIEFNQSIYSGFTIGKKYKLIGEIEIDDDCLPDRYGINLAIRNSTSQIGEAYGNYISSDITIRFPAESLTGILETPIIEILEGTARIVIYYLYKGIGTVRFGRCRLVEID